MEAIENGPAVTPMSDHVRSLVERLSDGKHRLIAEHPNPAVGTACYGPDVAVHVASLLSALSDQPAQSGEPVARAGEPRWGAYWYGSPPNKGANIWTVDNYGMRSDLILHVGPDKEHLNIARAVCTLHNQRLASPAPITAEQLAREMAEDAGHNWRTVIEHNFSDGPHSPDFWRHSARFVLSRLNGEKSS